MTIYSLAFLTVPDIGPVQAVQIAAQAGFDKVGMRLLPATTEESPYPLLSDRKVLAEVQAALADTGITMGDVELIRLRPETDTKDFLPFFERAQALGASQVVVVSDDPEPHRMSDNFARLCDLSRTFGLTMNLEPMPWTAVRDLHQAKKILEDINCNNAGILIDAFHFYRRHTSLTDLEQLPAHYINICQICDAPRKFDPSADAIRQQARTARLVPGYGDLDLLGLLQRIPRTATISVEVPNSQLLKKVPPLERSKLCLEATVAIVRSVVGSQE